MGWSVPAAVVTAAVAAWALLPCALAAVAALWRSSGRRAEAVARACHEARQPLAAAHLALHAAARRGELGPARVAALQLELRRVALALDDLHAAGRGTLLPDRVADVDLTDLLRCQVATWDDVARAHGAEVVLRDVAAAGVVRADQLRLAQALGNVVANAIEHGGGRVEVRAHRFSDRVRVEVADAGPGLPAPVADLVRRPRAGRGRRGRGLAIASGVLSRHGGRLTGDRGAVVLELPTAAPEPVLAGRPLAPGLLPEPA